MMLLAGFNQVMQTQVLHAFFIVFSLLLTKLEKAEREERKEKKQQQKQHSVTRFE